MAVSNVSGSGSFGSIYSAYGNYPWGFASSSQIAASMPATAGTVWAVWQIGIVGLPAGKVVTGITITGPISFGVTGGLRTANLYVYANSVFNTFQGANGVGPIASLTGNASGNVNYVYKPANLTSDNLEAGSFYLGFAVQTDGVNPGGGNGTFNFGALSWSIYTAPDDPAPPVGATSSKLTNPAANFNPGVFPGGQFQPLTSQLLGPLPQQYYSANFGVPYNKGFVFVDNGSNSGLIRQQGYGNNAGSPYICNSGVITVAAYTVPGIYTFQCAVSGLSQADPANQTLYTQVRVRNRAYTRMFTEA